MGDGEKEAQMDDGGLKGGSQQIVNITSSDNGAQSKRECTGQPVAVMDAVENEL